MRIKNFIFVSFLSLSVFFIVSCTAIPQKEYERVTTLRDKAIKYDAVQTYAQSEFNIAEDNYIKAQVIIQAENEEEGKNAMSMLLISQTNFNTVIDTGYPNYAGDLKGLTDKEIASNEEIKSSVLFATNIDQANLVYQEALASLEASDYDVAISKLLIAKEQYTTIYNMAKEKLDKSDTTLSDVKNKLNDLEKLTKELDALKKSSK